MHHSRCQTHFTHAQNTLGAVDVLTILQRSLFTFSPRRNVIDFSLTYLNSKTPHTQARTHYTRKINIEYTKTRTNFHSLFQQQNYVFIVILVYLSLVKLMTGDIKKNQHRIWLNAQKLGFCALLRRTQTICLTATKCTHTEKKRTTNIPDAIIMLAKWNCIRN